MIHVCWKHQSITHGLLGCRECRAARVREIVDLCSAETAEKIRQIFERPAASPRREDSDG